MRILLAAATPFEIKTTLDGLSTDKVTNVITGIGLLAAAWSIQSAIHKNRPDLVIQAGIGGCFDTSMPLGSTVLIGEESVADLGVEEHGQFRTLFDMKFLEPGEPPYTYSRLVNPHIGRLLLPGSSVCTGISVNEVSTRPERIAYLIQQYRPVVESMEGAALHYVCLREGIPFLQIRSLSNYIGERDKRLWQMGTAISSLNTVLKQYLDHLSSKSTI
jgi:futalosine hydrolase